MFLWHWWLAGWSKYFPISHFLVALARPRTYCTSKTPSSHFITFQPSPGGSQAMNGMYTLLQQGSNIISVFQFSFYQTQVYLGPNLWAWTLDLSIYPTPRPCANLTDVTLSDEDTNLIRNLKKFKPIIPLHSSDIY